MFTVLILYRWYDSGEQLGDYLVWGCDGFWSWGGGFVSGINLIIIVISSIGNKLSNLISYHHLQQQQIPPLLLLFSLHPLIYIIITFPSTKHNPPQLIGLYLHHYTH